MVENTNSNPSGNTNIDSSASIGKGEKSSKSRIARIGEKIKAFFTMIFNAIRSVISFLNPFKKSTKTNTEKTEEFEMKSKGASNDDVIAQQNEADSNLVHDSSTGNQSGDKVTQDINDENKNASKKDEQNLDSSHS